MKVNYKVKKHYWELINILFPPFCAGCGQEGEIWCQACQTRSMRKSEICPSCDRVSFGGKICEKCVGSPPSFDALYAHGLYLGNLQKAIHSLKYNRQISFGMKIGELIGERIKKRDWEIDFVTAIPLGKKRRKERGYNQALVIAESIANHNKIPLIDNVITRRKETISQVGLSLVERNQNVKDAFSVKKNYISGKNILLVDDVFTTGSTLNEASRTLKLQGVDNVFVSVIATVP